MEIFEQEDYFINEHAEAWIQELESGNWKQTSGTLCSNGKYCCLGVLAEISGELVHPENKAYSPYIPGADRSKLTGTLSKKLQKKYGLFSELGEVKKSSASGYSVKFSKDIHAGSLIEANDGGATFKQIAKVLRKYPERFFKPIKKT